MVLALAVSQHHTGKKERKRGKKGGREEGRNGGREEGREGGRV